MGLLCPKCRTQYLALLNFIWLASAYQSNLSRFLCRALLPLSKFVLPHKLALSANLLRVHLIPSSRSLIKVFLKAGPNIKLWATPFVNFSLHIFTGKLILANNNMKPVNFIKTKYSPPLPLSPREFVYHFYYYSNSTTQQKQCCSGIFTSDLEQLLLKFQVKCFFPKLVW